MMLQAREAQLPPLAQAVEEELGVRNPDSPAEVLRALHARGLQVETTDTKELRQHDHHPGVRELLAFRSAAAFVRDIGRKALV